MHIRKTITGTRTVLNDGLARVRNWERLVSECSHNNPVGADGFDAAAFPKVAAVSVNDVTHPQRLSHYSPACADLSRQERR